MQISWLSLLPPFIVVFSAFILRKLNIALLMGIISAALIATNWSILQASNLTVTRLTGQLKDIDNLYLYAFLLIIGILIVLINLTGGATTFATTITKKLRNARAAQSSSFMLSLLLFIDDYLSILTVGSVMSPITDRFKISRLKLAFLVHSLAGSVVILMPVSSWVAAITAYLDQAGIGPTPAQNLKILADPFYIYLRTIPFIFYSFLMIVSVWFIIRKNISFGPMKKYEQKAQAIDNPTITHKKSIGTISDLLIPIITLLTTVMIGIPYTGGYYLLGGSYTLIESFKNNQQTFFVMFVAGILALSIGILSAFIHKTLTGRQIPSMIMRGIQLMYEPVLMVFLASTLGLMLRNDLHTGRYLAQLLIGTTSISLLPIMFFIASLLTTLATGAAWGTFALMLSIAVPMLTSLLQVTVPADPQMIPILFPVLGAIFSGAVCGDHISPLSETTIMTATSTHVSPIRHAYTQFPYTIPAITCTALAFIISGYLIHFSTWINVIVSLGVSITLCLILLTLSSKALKS